MAKDIATGLGLTAIIYAVAAGVPVFGFFGALLLPLPTLFYRVKCGRQTGVIISGCAALMFLALSDGLTPDLFFFIDLLVIGLVLGELFERRVPIERTVAATAGVALGAGVLALVVAGNLAGRGIVSLVNGYVAGNLEMTLELYRSMGMTAENVALITESMDRIQHVLIRLLPAMAATAALVVVWANLIMGRTVLSRYGLKAPDFGSLNRWKAPEALVWVAIGGALLLLLPQTSVKLIGANVVLILVTIYFFQGIAIVAYYFDRKRMPRPMRIFLYSLIVIQQIFLLLVVALGFFDLWFNFRRLETETRR